MPTTKANGPYTLTIQGSNRLTINDVLLGEVWLCSGQSNMAFPIAKSASKWMMAVESEAEVVPKATYPAIRIVTVAQKVADTAQRDVQDSWGYLVAADARKTVTGAGLVINKPPQYPGLTTIFNK